MKFKFNFIFYVLTIVGIFNYSPLLIAQNNRLITDKSAGVVWVDMPISYALNYLEKEYRTELYAISYCRTFEPEGGAGRIIIKYFDDVIMAFYSEEDNKFKFIINNNARIEQITVYDSTYKTKEGIYPGMLIKDAEKKIGKLVEIVMSDDGSGQYAEFSKMPKGITLKVFGAPFEEMEKGKRRFKTFEKDAKITSISISKY